MVASALKDKSVPPEFEYKKRRSSERRDQMLWAAMLLRDAGISS